MRKRAVPHSVPLSSGAGGGPRRQPGFWRPATGEQHKGARRAGIVGCLFLDTSFGQAKELPGGEQRQFDGQLNDDSSIEVLVYRKNQLLFAFLEGIAERFRGEV